VRKRLDVYHSQTKPLVEFYSRWAESGEANAPKYVKIAGVGSVTDIRDQIFKALRADTSRTERARVRDAPGHGPFSCCT
jgi:hypothetical protein